MICSCVTNAVRKISRGEKTEKFVVAVVHVRLHDVAAEPDAEPVQRQVGHLGAELQLRRCRRTAGWRPARVEVT